MKAFECGKCGAEMAWRSVQLDATRLFRDLSTALSQERSGG